MSTVLAERSLAVPAARYGLSHDFIMEAVNEGIRDSLHMDFSFKERHDVRLKPAFDTACWSYLPPHKVFVGTEVCEKDCVRAGLSNNQLVKYIKNHYFHELAHARCTERDLAWVNVKLKGISVPFRLFNLFEDARIEHIFRTEAKYKFEWLTFETLPESFSPASVFFAFIQAEGDSEVVSAWAATSPKDLSELVARVYEYYLESITTKMVARTALFPLLKRWMAEFGSPPEKSQGGPKDLSLSLTLLSSAAAAQDFQSDCKPVTLPKSEDERAPVTLTSIQRSTDLLARFKGATTLDRTRISRIVQKFDKLFVSKSRYVTTDVPQKRISMKNVFSGKSPYRQKATNAYKVKEVHIIFDLSGSMSGVPLEEGLLLLAALSELSLRRRIRGQVAFSAVTGGVAHHEVLALPIPLKVLEAIAANGSAEGLDAALRSTLPMAKKADYTFVYTDADIYDAPVDKSELRAKGVETMGLYVGEATPDILDSMNKYFSKTLVRDKTEALVDAMLLQLK